MLLEAGGHRLSFTGDCLLVRCGVRQRHGCRDRISRLQDVCAGCLALPLDGDGSDVRRGSCENRMATVESSRPEPFAVLG